MPDYQTHCRADLSLRPAQMDDAARLFDWRTDAATRAASLSQDDFSYDHHCQWLQNSLASADRQIFIAQIADDPIGMVRADRDGPGWLLSWAIAPAWRGRGLARPMVAALAMRLQAPLHAQIRADNRPSLAVASALGLRPIAASAEPSGLAHKDLCTSVIDLYSRDWIHAVG
jgi:RimJ/RimL family protein N-acetyltransferase